MPVPTWLSQVLTEQVGRLVDGIVDGKQLCIDPGRAAWLAYLDIYVLDAGAMGFGVLYKVSYSVSIVEFAWLRACNRSKSRCTHGLCQSLASGAQPCALHHALVPADARDICHISARPRCADGSLLDVTLLAAVAALSSLRLPAVRVNDDGNVVPAGDDTDDGDAPSAADSMAVDEKGQPGGRYRMLARSLLRHSLQPADTTSQSTSRMARAISRAPANGNLLPGVNWRAIVGLCESAGQPECWAWREQLDVQQGRQPQDAGV